MFFVVEPRRNHAGGSMRALNSAAFSCLLLFCSAGSARAADEISVETARRDDALEVVCRAMLDAPLDLVWRTLTDYDRLAEFIPGMRASRVVERRGAVTVVEQTGEARFLFLTFPLEVTLASTERAPYAIDVRMLKGNLKRLEGAYRIEPQAGGKVLLTWTGQIEALSMPPLLGEMLMRASIEDQFRGMVREVERRDTLRRERERETKR
jgi:ribosome-associated toxin RatA of RatAB toxin-antitoxin module